jgi:hypothetical protein
MVRAHAHTRLRSGNQCFHHRVKGKEKKKSLKKKNEAAEEEDDEPVEVIPVAESTPPRSPYKQMAQIQIGPRGQPTETLAPRAGAGQTGPTGSAVWPPPPPTPPSGPVTTTPPPPSSGDSSTAPPPQDPTAAGKQPPLRSPGHQPGAWDHPHLP